MITISIVANPLPSLTPAMRTTSLVPLPASPTASAPTLSPSHTGLVTTAPSPPPSDHNSTRPTAAWIGFLGVLLAALLVAAWNIGLARRRSREEERSRQRTAFAEAFKVYGRYKELPYAIRRRNIEDPAAERVRLSEIARDIQAELTYHQAWMDLESDKVATAYRNLVAELREVAGGQMREAWTMDAITTDAQMNMIIDMAGLGELESAYLSAVREHLDELAPWWCR